MFDPHRPTPARPSRPLPIVKRTETRPPSDGLVLRPCSLQGGKQPRILADDALDDFGRQAPVDGHGALAKSGSAGCRGGWRRLLPLAEPRDGAAGAEAMAGSGSAPGSAECEALGAHAVHVDDSFREAGGCTGLGDGGGDRGALARAGRGRRSPRAAAEARARRRGPRPSCRGFPDRVVHIDGQPAQRRSSSRGASARPKLPSTPFSSAPVPMAAGTSRSTFDPGPPACGTLCVVGGSDGRLAIAGRSSCPRPSSASPARSSRPRPGSTGWLRCTIAALPARRPRGHRRAPCGRCRSGRNPAPSRARAAPYGGSPRGGRSTDR